MSALFRAELANLLRLVEATEAAAKLDTNERERVRLHLQKRATHLHRISHREAGANRNIILTWVKKYARSTSPVSANKVSESTGIADDTVRKHLRALTEDGITTVVRTAGGQCRFYIEKK